MIVFVLVVLVVVVEMVLAVLVVFLVAVAPKGMDEGRFSRWYNNMLTQSIRLF